MIQWCLFFNFFVKTYRDIFLNQVLGCGRVASLVDLELLLRWVCPTTSSLAVLTPWVNVEWCPTNTVTSWKEFIIRTTESTVARFAVTCFLFKRDELQKHSYFLSEFDKYQLSYCSCNFVIRSLIIVAFKIVEADKSHVSDQITSC